jgi:MoaD family protein
MIKVQFYSHLRAALGVSEAEVEVHTVGEMLRALEQRFGEPFRERIKLCKIYVNGNNVGLGKGRRTRLHADDEVAILPPIAGG